MTAVCWNRFPNFKPSEFKCGCGCEQEHVEMDCDLLFILQAIRNIWGTVNISKGGGNRCKAYNATLANSIPNSDHLGGHAADFSVVSMRSSKAKRLEVLKYAMQMPGFKYGYCNGYMAKNGKITAYSAPWMGTAIHISVGGY